MVSELGIQLESSKRQLSKLTSESNRLAVRLKRWPNGSFETAAFPQIDSSRKDSSRSRPGVASLKIKIQRREGAFVIQTPAPAEVAETYRLQWSAEGNWLLWQLASIEIAETSDDSNYVGDLRRYCVTQ